MIDLVSMKLENSFDFNDKIDYFYLDAFSMYSKEVDSIPMLSREDERELLQRAVNGDLDARNKVIEANLRYVIYMAKKYKDQSYYFEDLIQAGNIGLMKAIDKFDMSNECGAIGYGTYWIKQNIQRTIDNECRIIRIPVYAIDKLRKISKIKEEALKQFNKKVTNNDIAKQLGVSKGYVEQLSKISEPLSLEAPIDDEENSTLKDFIPDYSSKRFIEQVEEKDLQEKVRTFLGKFLTEKQRTILEKRWGIGYIRPFTAREIAEQEKTSTQNISEIELRALQRLRKACLDKRNIAMFEEYIDISKDIDINARFLRK